MSTFQKVDASLEDLNSRVSHLESFYGEANHRMQERLAELERGVRVIGKGFLELVSRLPVSLLQSNDLVLWDAVKDLMVELHTEPDEAFMRRFWELLAATNFRHTVIANFKGDDDLFYHSADHVIVALNEKFRLFDSDSDVVKIGCGAGRVSHSFIGKVKSFIGVDISPSMLEQARRRIADQNFKFLLSQGSNLEFLPSRSCDLVFSFIVLQHMPEQVMWTHLGEAARLLRLGGRLLFTLPLAGGYTETRAQPQDLWHVRTYSKDEVVAFLAKQGFEIDAAYDEGNDWNPTSPT